MPAAEQRRRELALTAHAAGSALPGARRCGKCASRASPRRAAAPRRRGARRDCARRTAQRGGVRCAAAAAAAAVGAVAGAGGALKHNRRAGAWRVEAKESEDLGSP